MNDNKKIPKEPVQSDVEIPTNDAPEDWEDVDNTCTDLWAELWGDAE